MAVPIIYKLIPHYAQITVQKYLYSHATFRQVSVAVSAFQHHNISKTIPRTKTQLVLGSVSCHEHTFMSRPLHQRACLFHSSLVFTLWSVCR